MNAVPKPLEKGIEWEEHFAVGNNDDIRAFAKIIEDQNPLHHDSEAARSAGLEDIIAPGVMSLGFISTAIARGFPGAMVRRIEELSFLKPLYAGMEPSVRCRVATRPRLICDIAIEVHVGDVLIAQGLVVVLLPR